MIDSSQQTLLKWILLVLISGITMSLKYYPNHRALVFGGNNSESPSRAVPVNEPLRVALIESGGSHDEVTAAFYNTLGSIANAQVEMYLLRRRFGIDYIYEYILRRICLAPYTLDTPHGFKPNDENPPNLIVMITCEHDLVAVDVTIDHYYTYGPENQHIICVVHNTREITRLEKRVRRWVKAKRLRFITLSQHAANYLRQTIENSWDMDIYRDIRIDVFPPLFNPPLPPTSRSRVDPNISVAIQGNFEDTRRSYIKTFLDFEKLLNHLPPTLRSRMQMKVIGHGPQIGIPQQVLPYITVNFSIDYIPYYRALHEAIAIIPAFASEEYLTSKASSSVAASLLARVPIVASSKLLQSYAYLSKNAVWKIDDSDTTELQALERLLLRENWEEIVHQKRQIIQKNADTLQEQNRQLMERIVAETMGHS